MKLCVLFVQLDRRLVSVDLRREEQHGGKGWTETLTYLTPGNSPSVQLSEPSFHSSVGLGFHPSECKLN